MPDKGTFVPRDTRQKGLEYDDPVFRNQGMIGTLENRKAILVGPFLCAEGCVPTSGVIWITPDHSKVAINDVTAQYDEEQEVYRMLLHRGCYYDGAWQDPERFEGLILKEWAERRERYQRGVLDEIDRGRLFNVRLRGDGKDAGMTDILWGHVWSRWVYNTLTERVWEAAGYA